MDCQIFVRMDNYFRASGDKQVIVKHVERIYNVYMIRGGGGESKGKFFMEQAKMTPRKELCESKVSVMPFLPCY